MRAWSVFIVTLLSGCGLVAEFDAPLFEESDASALDGDLDGRVRDAGRRDAPRDATGDARGSDAGPTDAGSADAFPEIGVADATLVDAIVGLSCPAGYSTNDVGTCYRFGAEPRNWQDAELDCESDGGHLVVINGPVEDALIPDFHWIGYSETIEEGTFLWVTGAGASTYEAWEAPDPDMLDDAWCTVQRPGGWHDDNWWETKAYVCEYDGDPADPTTWR